MSGIRGTTLRARAIHPVRLLRVSMVSLVLGAALAVRAGGSAEAIWDLSLAIPESNGERSISLDPFDHFHVIMRNTSAGVQKIWKESNSWGYQALYFELIDDEGRKVAVHKKPRGWRKNVPGYWVLQSGEAVVWDVFLAGERWEDLPFRGDVTTMKMRAVIEIPEDDKSRELGVWTGRITSPIYEFVFRR